VVIEQLEEQLLLETIIKAAAQVEEILTLMVKMEVQE
tara:strand:+ start:322 stop:432 length:111 start_codon:yes stop_codon:yes gene_type:complete